MPEPRAPAHAGWGGFPSAAASRRAASGLEVQSRGARGRPAGERVREPVLLCMERGGRCPRRPRALGRAVSPLPVSHVAPGIASGPGLAE